MTPPKIGQKAVTDARGDSLLRVALAIAVLTGGNGLLHWREVRIAGNRRRPLVPGTALSSAA